MSQIKKDIPTLKCLLIGPAGSGKTSLIQSHLTGDFDQNYKPTRSAEECGLTFWTNRGPICFNVLEMTADGLMEHYKQANCAIFLYDVTSSDSYNALPTLMDDLDCYCPDIPRVMCGNKLDVSMDSSKLRNSNSELLLSVKLRHNLVNPFLWLAREVYGDNKLRIVPMPAPAPPYAPIDVATQFKLLLDLPPPPKEDDDGY